MNKAMQALAVVAIMAFTAGAPMAETSKVWYVSPGLWSSKTCDAYTESQIAGLKIALYYATGLWTEWNPNAPGPGGVPRDVGGGFATLLPVENGNLITAQGIQQAWALENARFYASRESCLEWEAIFAAIGAPNRRR